MHYLIIFYQFFYGVHENVENVKNQKLFLAVYCILESSRLQKSLQLLLWLLLQYTCYFLGTGYRLNVHIIQ